MKEKRKKQTIVLLIIFFVGLSVMLYPAIADYWNSKTQTEAIVDYEQILLNMPKEDYSNVFKEADAYNEELAALDMPLIEYEKVDGYFDILNVNGVGMMGYIMIDKIGVELPVYHTTDESILNIAVGHLQGSSFPVGGKNTHAVVSAHRGLPSSTLFTHLDHLEIGDQYQFKILDETITYEIDQILTVEPDETKELAIVEGEEYCTLVTCTPYGINTHRLLVRGVKVDAFKTSKLYITSDAYRIDSLIVTPIVALPMIFILMIIVLAQPVKKDVIGDEFV